MDFLDLTLAQTVLPFRLALSTNITKPGNEIEHFLTKENGSFSQIRWLFVVGDMWRCMRQTRHVFSDRCSEKSSLLSHKLFSCSKRVMQ